MSGKGLKELLNDSRQYLASIKNNAKMVSVRVEGYVKRWNL